MAKSPKPSPVTVAFVSLGCFKNVVDTEVLAGMLSQRGLRLVPEYQPADWLIINTCGFIRDAKQESQDEILQALERKERSEVKRVAVFGCLAQRYGSELGQMFPGLDILWGVNDMDALAEAIAAGEPAPYRNRSLFLYSDRDPRVPVTLPNTSFIKISEGCSMRCSFCAIPSIRGPYRSRTIDSVRREAEQLHRRGVQELNLVSQNTTFFGKDTGPRSRLPDLLQAVSGIGFRWVRLLYLMPEEMNDEILAAFSAPTVLPYFDLPFQHVAVPVLKRMNRGGGAESHLALVERIRKAFPGAVLRASFIVGFPGETQRDFDELMEFARASRIERIGVFAYSNEEGTASFGLKKQIPPSIAQARREQLLDVSDGNLERFNRRLCDTLQEFLPQGPWNNGQTVGRIAGQAPEVDGWAEISTPFADDWGIVPVRISEFQNQILKGEPA